MKNFFIEFIQNILNLQERFLENKYKKKLTVLNYDKNSMVKSRLSSGASLTLSGELEKNKKRVADEVKKILTEKNGDLIAILDYAKEKGTSYYLIKNAKKILSPINETEGLIFPKKNLQALYLNIFVKRKFSFNTELMFVYDEKKLSDYRVLYNFYKWYACKSLLPGFDEETLERFKNVFDYENKEKLDTLNYKDIMALKQAIDRDREAMEFVLKYMREKEGAKNAYDIMKNNDSGASV